MIIKIIILHIYNNKKSLINHTQLKNSQNICFYSSKFNIHDNSKLDLIYLQN